jgi:putative salt-induced outer membrane protein
MKSFILVLLPLLTLSSAFSGVSNESEVGVASANGNTKTQSYTIKQLNELKWANNIARVNGRYLNARANGVETARYFMLGGRYENLVSSHWSYFAGETLEKDKFASIDQRLLTDAGTKYRFVDSEQTKLSSELGYRYMHEDRLDNSTAFSNLGRLYAEWEQKWNPSFSTKYWAEFLPNFSDPKDWMFNTEISLSAMLNSVFSLKTGLLLRYDHSPAPRILYKTDSLFSSALVAKF